MTPVPEFPGRLEAFFTDRLMRQRQASPHTLGGYRDTFRLLLTFAQQQLKKAPSRLAIEDLDAPFIGAFLDHWSRRVATVRGRATSVAASTVLRYLALQAGARGRDQRVWRCRANGTIAADRVLFDAPEMEALWPPRSAHGQGNATMRCCW
jgi:hypothetical protein